MGLPAEAARLRDDPEALRAAVAKHGSGRALARAVGVDESTVRRWARLANIPLRGKAGGHATSTVLSPEAARLRDDRAQFTEALSEHRSGSALARAIGVNPTTVIRWAERHGVELNAVGGQYLYLPADAQRLREDPAAMKEAVARHGSDRNIAAAYGVGRRAIGRWRDAHGLAPADAGGHRLSPEAERLRDDADALRAALAEHGSDRAVSRAVQVAPSTVGEWRRAHGIS